MAHDIPLTPEEKARIARNAYAREWAKRNPDKIKSYAKKHYAKKYDQMVEEWRKEWDTQEGGNINE